MEFFLLDVRCFVFRIGGSVIFSWLVGGELDVKIIFVGLGGFVMGIDGFSSVVEIDFELLSFLGWIIWFLDEFLVIVGLILVLGLVGMYNVDSS